MTAAAEGGETAPAKIDPENLALRGRPKRAVRFRRDVIIVLAACTIAATAAVAWSALRPANVDVVPRDADERPALAAAPSETLEGIPANYAEIPRDGALRDLGRPPSSLGSNGEPNIAVDRKIAEADARREALRRREAEEQAARESGLMIDVKPRLVEDITVEEGDLPVGTLRASNAVHDNPAGAHRAEIIRGTKAQESGFLNPHHLAAPSSPYMVQAGSVIAASLITGLNSELPGLVTAQITQNVHDSVTGDALLIPQGSRLIGRYDNVVARGQKRALVVWQRIILPDGSSLNIDDMPATDEQGYAGLSDRVEQHEGALLKGVALATLLGVGTEIAWDSDENAVARAIRESAQESGARASDQIVRRNLDIQPTLIVRPGWDFRIIVHKDLILPPWLSDVEMP